MNSEFSIFTKKFKTEIVDGKTYIYVLCDLSINEEEIIEKFIINRRGEYISDDKKVFYIPRIINQKSLIAIFKEIGLIKESSKDKSKILSSDNGDLNIPIRVLYNDEIIKFGAYKGSYFSNLSIDYLRWLEENHIDKRIKEIARYFISEKSKVYIKL